MFKFTWEYITRNWYKICTAALLLQPRYGLQTQCFLSRTQSVSDLGLCCPLFGQSEPSSGPGQVLVLVQSRFNLWPSLLLPGQTVTDYMDSLQVLLLVLAPKRDKTSDHLWMSQNTLSWLWFLKNVGHEVFDLVLKQDNATCSLKCE